MLNVDHLLSFSDISSWNRFCAMHEDQKSVASLSARLAIGLTVACSLGLCFYVSSADWMGHFFTTLAVYLVPPAFVLACLFMQSRIRMISTGMVLVGVTLLTLAMIRISSGGTSPTGLQESGGSLIQSLCVFSIGTGALLMLGGLLMLTLRPFHDQKFSNDGDLHAS